MKEFQNEGEFQKWVIDRFRGLMAISHYLDLSSMTDDIPDLNATVDGWEFWLELKFDTFKMLHTGYDRFGWSKMQRRQLEWLQKRKQAGAEVCGILGYAIAKGDHTQTPYLVYHDVDYYLQEIWQKDKHSMGSIILGPGSIGAHCIRTGADLLDFLYSACAPLRRNAR